MKLKELSPSRKAFFTERLKDNPELIPLRDKLLEIGGLEIVPRPECDLSKLLERGQLFNLDVELEIMHPSRCHQNVGELWSLWPEKNKIATGWALTDDGLWRQHSWIIHEDTIFETTEKRLKYFGIVLNEEESELFYFNNCWGEPKFY